VFSGQGDPGDPLVGVELALARRWPESTIEPSLDRIGALVDLLGQPQRAFPLVHITGTNGKTSTARMVDALLREHGLRTGRYTSPHLQSITERICLDGVPLDPGAFAARYAEIAPYLDVVDHDQPYPLSFFEVLTAMAFAAFADAPIDAGVIEVGLGGRWDATNVADAAVAVLTSIDLDHTRLLGSTVSAIAAEKAGIVKPGATVVLGDQEESVAVVVLKRAAEVGAVPLRAGLDFAITRRSIALGGQLFDLRGAAGEYPEIYLPLHGAHQAANAACALVAVESFLGRALDPDLVRSGFARADSPGRLEVVRRSPTVLIDGAHNPAGARALARALAEAFGFARLVGVLAVLADKDARGLLEALEPVLDALVLTRNSSPRALPAGDLAGIAREVFDPKPVVVVDRLDAALDAAARIADESPDPGGTGIVVTGSVITAGEARTLLRPAGGRR